MVLNSITSGNFKKIVKDKNFAQDVFSVHAKIIETMMIMLRTIRGVIFLSK